MTTTQATPRPATLNISGLVSLTDAYLAGSTETHRAVHAAATAMLRLECRSPVVGLGLDNLIGVIAAGADRTEIERAERYVAECWAEFVPPGVVTKAVVS